MMRILYILPKNYLSFFLGKLANLKIPKPFSTWLIKSFADYYKINLDTASKDVTEYDSLGDFFIRDLKHYPDLNSSSFVSPVEATLRSFGKIDQHKIVQVKGIEYSIIDLLGDKTEAQSFLNGYYLNFYLSPQDYHQVHAPINGKITSSTYIKGKLWPVNDWSLNTINGLFAVNERIITYMETELGRIALIMVGATNVGKITVSYDDWLSNDIFNAKGLDNVNTHYYENQISIAKGEKLGVFHMGSAVVILIEREIGLINKKENQHQDLFSPLL